MKWGENMQLKERFNSHFIPCLQAYFGWSQQSLFLRRNLFGHKFETQR